MEIEKNIDKVEEDSGLPFISKHFVTGEKVWCYYHSTQFFKPPMCGRILFKLPFRIKHHFSSFYDDGKDGKCYWYLVLMENFLFVLMPANCIVNLMEAIEKHDKNNKTPLDVKQIDAWEHLQKWQADRVRFLNY